MDNIEDILRALAEDAPEDSGSKDEVSQDGGLFSGLDLGSMAKSLDFSALPGTPPTMRSCSWR